MTVSPLPWRGGVAFDQRNGDRTIRVAAHPDGRTVTLSLWRGDRCVATHQMAAEDVSQLIGLLADAMSVLVEPTASQAAAR